MNSYFFKMRNIYFFLKGCNNYSLVGVIISKINMFPNKQTNFSYAHNNYKNKKNHKK